MKESITLYSPPDYLDMATRFFEKYDFKETVTCPEVKMKSLKQVKKRVCRFCRLSKPTVNFKNDAHIFPHQLGNKYLLSDFECDNCNTLFGKYENELAKFLGPVRFLQGINGKEKSHFTAADKKIRVEKSGAFGIPDAISISREDVEDNSIEVDRATGNGTIRFTKHTYTPIKVYKAILKIALSCLNEDDIKEYDLAIKYILTEELDDKIGGFTKVFTYQLPMSLGYREPIGIIYEKKNALEDLPTHIFVLYFANLIYQITLPLNKNDLRFYNGKTIGLRLCPPIFADWGYAQTVIIQDNVFDFSSKEPVRKEKEIFAYQMDTEALKQAVIYDAQTGKINNDISGFKETAKLVLVKEGTVIKIP